MTRRRGATVIDIWKACTAVCIRSALLAVVTLCAFLVIGVLLASAAHADDDVSSDDLGSAVSAVMNAGTDASDATPSILPSDSGEIGESADRWTSDLSERQRGSSDDETDASGSEDNKTDASGTDDGIGIGPAGSTIGRAGDLADQVTASATDSPSSARSSPASTTCRTNTSRRRRPASRSHRGARPDLRRLRHRRSQLSRARS